MKRQALGEQRISGSIWKPGPSSFFPQLDSMVVSRGPECKRTRRGGRKKKLLAAPVSRYLHSSLSFFQHGVCRRTSCWPSNIQTDRQVFLSPFFLGGTESCVLPVSHFFLVEEQKIWLWKIKGGKTDEYYPTTMEHQTHGHIKGLLALLVDWQHLPSVLFCIHHVVLLPLNLLFPLLYRAKSSE